MNNKGQSLVSFILFLPVIFIMITIVWEIGNLSVLKNKYEDEIISTIQYGLKHIDNPNLKDDLSILLDANLEGSKSIKIENNTIRINVTCKKGSMYTAVLKTNHEINMTYIGYIKDGKIFINKE